MTEAHGSSTLRPALTMMALGMALIGRYLLVSELPWLALGAFLIAITAFNGLIDLDGADGVAADDTSASDRAVPPAGQHFRSYLGTLARALDPRDAIGAARQTTVRAPMVAACGFLSLAAGVSVAAVLHARADSAQVSYGNVTALWVLAIGLYLAAALLAQGWLSRAVVAARLREHRGALVDAGVLLGLALLLRAIALDRAPDVISGDEGLIGAAARDMFSGDGGMFFGTLYGYGTAYYKLVSMALFGWGDGTNMAALRLPAAIGGALAVPATYALGRQLFGRRVGLVAGVLVATSHIHVHLSRTAHGQSIDSLTAAMALFAFARGLDRRSSAWMAIAGVWLGLAQYGYTAGRLIDLVIVAFVVQLLFLDPARLRGAWPGLATAFGAALVTAAPMIRWSIDHSPEYFDRVDKAGFVQTGEMAGRMTQTGASAWAVLAEQASNAVRAVLVVPVSGFYGARIPMLDAIWAILFVLAAGYALRRVRDWRFLLLVLDVIGGLVVLLLGGLALHATYRVLGILPSIAVLAAFALVTLVERDLRGVNAPAWLCHALVGAVVAVVAIYNVRYYFGEYIPNCTYMDASTAAASIGGRFVAAKAGADDTVLILDSPGYNIAGHTAAVFFIRRRAASVPGTAPDVPAPGSPGDEGFAYVVGQDIGNLADLVRSAAPAIVMAGPERADQIDALASALPGGERTTLRRCGEPVFAVYQVGPPEQR